MFHRCATRRDDKTLFVGGKIIKQKAHSHEWYDRRARLVKGYGSTTEGLDVGAFSGEEVYLDMVKAHLSPEKDVLDAGCGHGDVPLELATLCRSVIAYDRVESYIELGRENAMKLGIENVTFVLDSSSSKANNGHARMPCEDHSVDVIISRRGPVHWIADVKRVIRRGGVVIQLCMLGDVQGPSWQAEMPESLRSNLSHLPLSMRDHVEKALKEAAIEMHSCWIFDVPAFATVDCAETFYKMLTNIREPEEKPPYEDVAGQLQNVLDKYAPDGKLDMRQQRLLWKAVVD